ncbi:MAG: hypothetical protein HZC55_25895 [Verrucomicrobia bacterium]|nr:hypothetical protein [Verrucomicrobiota bacterium]
MIRRRQTQVFSLSFLDCICCGFGAIILIFVLNIGSRHKEKLESLLEVQRALAEKAAALANIQAARVEVQRNNQRITRQVTEARLRNDEIQALVAELERSLQHEKRGQQALLVDLDELKKEIAARQKKPEHDIVLPDVKPTPLGLPIGNNYIAIIVDTSGSMRDPNHGGLWPIVIRTIDSVLDSYPTIDGIQLIDGDGRFILGRRNASRTAAWLPDTPQTRDAIKRTLRRYDQDTVSNPVPGVYNAMRFLFDPDNPKMRMGIFVFGDEFNSPDSADSVIRRLDELNPADDNGARKVTINAVGFPTTIRYQFSMGNTGLRFANLMRTVTYLHGGAFIALQDL